MINSLQGESGRSRHRSNVSVHIQRSNEGTNRPRNTNPTSSNNPTNPRPAGTSHQTRINPRLSGEIPRTRVSNSNFNPSQSQGIRPPTGGTRTSTFAQQSSHARSSNTLSNTMIPRSNAQPLTRANQQNPSRRSTTINSTTNQNETTQVQRPQIRVRQVQQNPSRHSNTISTNRTENASNERLSQPSEIVRHSLHRPSISSSNANSNTDRMNNNSRNPPKLSSTLPSNQRLIRNPQPQEPTPSYRNQHILEPRNRPSQRATAPSDNVGTTQEPQVLLRASLNNPLPNNQENTTSTNRPATIRQPIANQTSNSIRTATNESSHSIRNPTTESNHSIRTAINEPNHSIRTTTNEPNNSIRNSINESSNSIRTTTNESSHPIRSQSTTTASTLTNINSRSQNPAPETPLINQVTRPQPTATVTRQQPPSTEGRTTTNIRQTPTPPPANNFILLGQVDRPQGIDQRANDGEESLGLFDELFSLLDSFPLNLVPLLPIMFESSFGALLQNVIPLYLAQVERRQLIQAIDESLREASNPKPEPPKKVKLTSHTINRQDTVNGRQCAICISDFEEGEKTVMLKCGHFFHKDCLMPWFLEHHTCPTCREDIDEGDLA